MKPISINQLAFGSLRRSSRQYLTLAIGVFLAVYFAAVMLLFGASIPQTLQTMHNDRQGNQDYVFFNIGDAPMDELVHAGLVAEYGMTEILAETEKRPNTNFSSFSLARFDQIALQMTGKRIISGRLPDKAGEIALEQETLSLQRITAKPGDIISLVLKIPDGSDYLTKTITKEYLLTGILADQRLYLLNEVYDSHYAYKEYPAAILSDSEKIEAGGKAIRTAYVKLAPNIDPMDSRIQDFANSYGIRVQWTGFEGLSEIFNNDLDSSNIVSTLVLALFLALILLLAACLGIVNAFSSNLQQRKQQIGMLRAVGATKQQIRQIFGRVAMLISVFTIPLALTFSCLTVWGITRLLGPTYHFYPQPGVLAIVAVLSVTSVWISSRIPLRRASQISPMQAIRDVDLSRRMKTRKIRSRSKFKISSLLASRNLKLHRNSLLGITIFIVISLLLVMIIPFYMEGQLNTLSLKLADYRILKSTYQEDLINYQYRSGGLNDGDVAEMAALPGVESVDAIKELPLNLVVNQISKYFTLGGYNSKYDYLSDESVTDLVHSRPHAFENYQYVLEHYDYSQELLKVELKALSPQVLSSLQPYVYEGSIHLDRIAAGDEIVLVAPPAIQVSVTNDGSGYWGMGISGLASADLASTPKTGETIMVFKNDQFHVGDEITLSLLYSASPAKLDEAGGWIIPAEDAVRIDKKVTIGALLRPSKIAGDEIAPLTSIEGLSAIGFEVPYMDVRIKLKERPSPDMEDYLTDQLEIITNRSDGYRMDSFLSWSEQARKTTLIILLATGAIVIFLFAMVASMVNNTVTARIRAGRREIGTLRAVGATGHEIQKSYDLQLMTQFGLGSFLGLVIGWFLCYWISLQPNIPWPTWPTWQPLLFVGLLFLTCRLNIWLKVRRILRSSIVANIREL